MSSDLHELAAPYALDALDDRRASETSSGTSPSASAARRSSPSSRRRSPPSLSPPRARSRRRALRGRILEAARVESAAKVDCAPAQALGPAGGGDDRGRRGLRCDRARDLGELALQLARPGTQRQRGRTRSAVELLGADAQVKPLAAAPKAGCSSRAAEAAPHSSSAAFLRARGQDLRGLGDRRQDTASGRALPRRWRLLDRSCLERDVPTGAIVAVTLEREGGVTGANDRRSSFARWRLDVSATFGDARLPLVRRARLPGVERHVRRDAAQLSDEALLAAVADSDEDSPRRALRPLRTASPTAWRCASFVTRRLPRTRCRRRSSRSGAAAGGYRPERAKASTWVLTFVHRRAVDLVRREERRRARARGAVPEPEGPGADEAVVARSRREIVQDALSRLPADQREAIELAYYGGLTQSRACGAAQPAARNDQEPDVHRSPASDVLLVEAGFERA